MSNSSNDVLISGHEFQLGVLISILCLGPTVGSGFQFIRYGVRCSSVVRAFAHGAMGRRIDPSWGGPIELFLVPASAPRMV